MTRSCHGEKTLDPNNVGLREAAHRNSDPVLREFLRLLALCHTVMVEERGGELGSPVVDMNCQGWDFLMDKDRDWEWRRDPIGKGGWDPTGISVGIP